LHHRVSGLVQRDIDDNVLSSLWARGGHTKKIYDARYAVQLRPQSWVLQGSKWTGELTGESGRRPRHLRSGTIAGLPVHRGPYARRAQWMLP